MSIRWTSMLISMSYILLDSMWYFLVESSLCLFLIVYVLLYHGYRYIYQERVRILLSGLTPPYFSDPGSGYPFSIGCWGGRRGWIYNYLCNQCQSSLTLWVRISLRRGVLDSTLCDKVCKWLATGWWFCLATLVSPPIKLTANIKQKHCRKWY